MESHRCQSVSSAMEDPEREADVSELQRLVAVEEQRARLAAQVHNFMEVCWEKCVDKPGSKLDSRTETCLANCVNRFIDTTLSITNRFAQIIQKGGH
uniref:Mitochondrial import inner membrane translocase subunit n=2 Tax=Podarcis TaxID=42163 RepID=A0A670KK90_PODMU